MNAISMTTQIPIFDNLKEAKSHYKILWKLSDNAPVSHEILNFTQPKAPVVKAFPRCIVLSIFSEGERNKIVVAVPWTKVKTDD